VGHGIAARPFTSTIDLGGNWMMRTIRTLALMLVAVALFGAALAQTTLTIGRAGDVSDMNPFRQANNLTAEVTYQIHEGLMRYGPDLELVPMLATGWEIQPDGRTWRFFLREGVSFHTGNPFNAEVVKWNFETMLNPERPGVAAGLLTAFESLHVVDEYTLDVTLNEPNFIFLNILGAALFMIVDMEHYLAVGEANYGQQPSGTGAFKFVSWAPGERVVLERNPDYWGPVGAGVDRVVFQAIPDESARVLALLTGEIDMAFSVPADQMGLVERTPDLQVFRTPTFRTLFLESNIKHPRLTDAVRYAIAHAINRDQISSVIGENGVPAYGHGPEQSVGYYDHSLPFDPEESRRLLDADGWVPGSDGIRSRNGERLTLNVLTRGVTPGELDALQVVQLQLRNVGIEITLERVDAAAFTAAVNNGALRWKNEGLPPLTEMWTTGSGIRTGEVGYLQNRPLCFQTVRAWYAIDCTPEYDEAFALSQSPAPLEERLEGYRVMGEYIKLWQHRHPLFHVQSNIGAKASIQGFVVDPQDSLDLRGVSFR
jgi:peptide/nickel transport system substrate-binding protein